ncbi:hypothetical protein J3Q64DRAFT_1839560 [Phycomyces blakesleeanus]|uniref:E3 ubiquitin protein ligase n=1 Tax=Phycomyces blakesleeanus TaxID=4837 RepID=A0ABR3APY2_PHYBL
MSAHEKKRRWTEDAENSAPVSMPGTPTKPPLKKRFTSINNLSASALAPPLPPPPPPPVQTIPPSVENNIDNESDEEYGSLSKDTLLQRMKRSKVVKEESAAEEEKARSTEQKSDDDDSKRAAIRVQWRLMQNELVILVKSLANVDSTLPELPKDQPNESSLRDQLQTVQQATRILTERALEMSDKQALMTRWIKNDMEDLYICYDRNQRVLNELQEQEKSIIRQSEHASEGVLSMRKQVEDTIEELEETIGNLMQAEKRYDRSKSEVVASLNYGGLGGNKEKQVDPVEPSTKKMVSTYTPKMIAPETNKPGSIADQAVKQQLAEHQLIVDTRMKELEDLKHEREMLLEDTERLKTQLSMIDEERLMETEYYKNLQLSTEHYRARIYHLEQMRTQMERELDAISLERRQLVDQVKSEKLSQSMAMEAEMRRLENDLSRIRSQRDHFQMLLNEQGTKEVREREINEHVMTTAEREKQRIIAIQKQISEAKEIDQMAGPFAEELGTYKRIEAQLENSTAIVTALSDREADEPLDKPALEKIRNELRQEVEDKQRLLREWKDHTLPTTDARKNIQQLMSELDIKKEEKDKLQLMIDFFENNESQLLKQIDRVAAIYGRLEDQSSKKVLNLNQRRDQKMKLQAEKMKYAQTFASLKATKDKHMVNVTSLRRTSEQQMEHIRQLEEREKALEVKVEEKETSVRKAEKTVERYRVEVDDLIQKDSEYRINLERNDTQIHELQKVLKERVRTLDEEKQLRKRVDEDYEKMKRRWDMISQGDNPAEQQLAEECEELRCLSYSLQNTSAGKVHAYFL